MRSVSLAAGSDSLIYKVLNPEKRGGIKSVTIDKAMAIANALGVSPAWLAFGDDGVDLSEDVLREMVETAVSEIQPGMKIGQIRSAVASSLHAQLKLRQVVAGVQSKAVDESAHNKGVQSRAPTTQSDQATLHNA